MSPRGPAMSLRLKPLHPVFAAEASGIDLTQPISLDDGARPSTRR